MASPKSQIFPCLLALAFFFLFSASSEAREFIVGGKESSWKIPSSPDEFDKWASKNRFTIGDSLVLKYDAQTDSVLEVIESDYKSCSKQEPIKGFYDGNTTIQLDRSGPFYFISGADGHCEKGQKLAVEVLSAKHGSRTQTHSPAPSPAPSTASANRAPAPAPANDACSFMIQGFSGLASLVLAGSLVGFAILI